MRIALLHLSDLHVSGPDDPVVKRGPLIAAAVRTRLVGVSHCVIVVSGDLAYSGKEEEYLIGLDLLQAIREGVFPTPSEDNHSSLVIVPGNHDCDFSREGKARGLILEAVRDSVDESILSVTTEVQNSFFDVLQAIDPPSEMFSRLEWVYRVSVDGHTVDFRCLNTAWCSRLHEQQGTLRFPQKLEPRARANLSVAVLHHPFNWLDAGDARRLRRQLETCADIILTGHEHEHTRRTQHVATGERNEFIEGGVLGDSSSPDASAFNLILIDLATSKQRFVHFSLANGMYAPAEAAEPDWEPLQVSALKAHREFELTPKFRAYLEELGVSVEHPAKGAVTLDDVFVYPDLRHVLYNRQISGAVTTANQLDLGGETQRHYLITGSERSCKTSLAKRWYRDLLNAGVVPVLLDGKALRYIDERKFDAAVEAAFAEQYSAGSYEQFRQLPINRRALLIDDFHRMHLPSKKVNEFWGLVGDTYHHVVLLSYDFAHQVTAMTDARRLIAEHSRIEHYDIEQFGHVRRDDFIQKWFSLDPTLGENPEGLSRKVVEAERTLDSIIGKNFVPAYPVFLLSMLQGLETMGSMDLHASTHGYFYELLIKNDLAAGSSGVEYDIKVEFLAHLAYRSYQLGSEELSSEEFAEVHAKYEETYDIKKPLEQLQSELQRNKVVLRIGDSWRFRYDYIRFYFVALYLSKHLLDDAVQEDLTVLSATLHEPLSANILLFLAHLSKEPEVIDKMLARAKTIFAGQSPATLGRELQFLGDIEDDGNDLHFVERSPGESRRMLLAQRDEQPDGDDDTLQEEFAGVSDWMNEVGSAFKAMQILGQILKNFPGSLKAEPKAAIADECYGLGLRALGNMLEALSENREEFIEWLRAGYKEEYPHSTDVELTRLAQRSLAGLTRMAAYGGVQRIAAAVGSRDLMETFRKMREKYDTTAGRLIDVAIRLDQLDRLPKRDVVRLGVDLKEEPVPHSVLRMLAIRHFHLFDVPYQEKQSLCEHLGIPYTGMVKVDPRKRLLPRENAE